MVEEDPESALLLRAATGTWLKWPVETTTDGFLTYLPGMQADIVLINPDRTRSVIIDTKFTNIVGKGRHDNQTFKTSHLYQIYTYLRSQNLIEGGTREAMLLYPAMNVSISERAVIQGDLLRMETVDLSQPWQDIEEELIGVTTD